MTNFEQQIEKYGKICIFVDGPRPIFFDSIKECQQFIKPLYQVAEWYKGQILEYSVSKPKDSKEK